MNLPPWETHDRLCPNRRPTIAFPNSACSGCRAVVAARAEGYARGLIEGDHGGWRLWVCNTPCRTCALIAMRQHIAALRASTRDGTCM
jgi:hypothetical protein